MNNEKLLNSLLGSLKDKNPHVRAKAAEALGRIGDKKAFNYLNEALKDDDEEVRFKAKKALIDLGFIKKNVNVPEWSEYTPSLANANNKQKAYYKKWLKEFNKNNFLDIDGNLSYIFVFLYSVIADFLQNRDIDYIVEIFDKVNKGYGNYKSINQFLPIWKSDAYRYIGQYDKALEVIKKKGLLGFQASVFAQVISKTKSNFIDGNDLIQIVGINKLTNFGKDHKKEIAEVGTIFLDDFYKENGLNIVQYFLEKFNLQNLTENDLKELKKYIPNDENYQSLKIQYEIHNKRLTKDKNYNYLHGLFIGVPVIINPDLIEDKYVYIPSIITEAMKNETKRILRECENTVREEMDLPKIGEGWISETNLYYEIKETFPNEVVVHHGRPSWLGRQHLDVYFPEKNIGIEYQGEQHQNPLEYFGGEKAFKHREKLDKRKMDRCKENNCKLIYVYPNYDFKDIKEKIRENF